MGQIISFRADDHYTELVNAICKKGELNYNQALKISVDLLAQKSLDPNHSGQWFDRETVMKIYREMESKELTEVEEKRAQVDKELEKLAHMQDKVAVQIERLSERQDEIRKYEEELRAQEVELREAKRLYDDALREFKEKHKDEIIEGVKADMKARISDSIRQCLQWVKEEHERGEDMDRILREADVEQFVTVN